jgi:hypothetical protein
MPEYCLASDVGSRLGLNSAQRTQASSRLTTAIRRATIDVDQCWRDYGRSIPSTGASDGGSGLYTQTDTLKVIREICADLAAAYYMEDEGTFQTTGPDGTLRGGVLRERGEKNLMQIAHLGTI